MKKKIAILTLIVVALFVVSMLVGRYNTDPSMVLRLIASRFVPVEPTWNDTLETIIFGIRLPRAIIAMFVGAGLSISGAAFQGMFRNPLVSPGNLGVSSAAGFGAAVAIFLSLSGTMVQVVAFVFGIIGVTVTYFISRVYKTTPLLMLVLSGMVVGALFTSLTSLIKFVADPYEKLPAITFWLMGGLSSILPADMLLTVPPIIIGATGLILIRWRINILSMGDEEARSLGINTELLKVFIVICSTIITAAAVSAAGLIGWVGLVVPHMARMIVGPDHRVVLPTSFLIGAAYLLLIDNIARTVSAAEIPLGILTSVVGAPFFIYLIRKTKGAWS
ncbi:MAG TPA: iron ABC transporter permease [Firmicutes bacterium]|nr:iron ABC transporter permease [Bacillota bacterium]